MSRTERVGSQTCSRGLSGALFHAVVAKKGSGHRGVCGSQVSNWLVIKDIFREQMSRQVLRGNTVLLQQLHCCVCTHPFTQPILAPPTHSCLCSPCTMPSPSTPTLPLSHTTPSCQTLVFREVEVRVQILSPAAALGEDACS